MNHFVYLFSGLHGQGNLQPLMWTCATLAILAAILMVNPKTRNSETWLPVGCACVFLSLWMEKGVALVVGGFIPSPLETVFQYSPTLPELAITLGVWGLGFLILTILYKVALGVRQEIEAYGYMPSSDH
jgi:Ni/Fe-hydrogenase subunit HybB-like protein